MFSIFSPSKEKANKAFNKALETGNFGPALKLYKKLVEKEPNDYESLHNIGYIFLCLDQGADAIEYFIKANKIHESPIHCNNLGRSYQQIEKYSEAKDAYIKVMQLDTNDPIPWYNSTVCLREMGKVEESISELKNLLKKYPSHAGSSNDIALHYEEQGFIDKAISQLEKALSNDPDYTPSRLNMVRILCEKGNYPDLTEHLEYLAQQGAHIVVKAKEGQSKIVINGSIFFEGPYESLKMITIRSTSDRKNAR